MTEIKLKMDGTDEVHVVIEGGIEFTGTVTVCQMSGNAFRINGIIKEAADDSD